MNITLNGKQKDLPSASTLTQLLTSLGLPAETLVIELNALIIQPDSYSETTLSEGDRVEIIRFVGGG
ncbi:MAG: sulfur carrier protein ThiS [Proteobacteria bacterium]|nr:sulfur carrier protein ThiS [Pseudomonadota bacterium]MBU1417763.1 sulfur carrier protein ThiS [Pseudomonadota bacterium]MBU1456505.1 sulfur carrier protein ThiS [Pseudomonadota bacterium]